MKVASEGNTTKKGKKKTRKHHAKKMDIIHTILIIVKIFVIASSRF